MLWGPKLLQSIWRPLQPYKRWHSLINPEATQEYIKLLKTIPEPCCVKMSNGLTVVAETRTNVDHVCIGLFIDGGSRYEQPNENGMAHYFEHIAFKETQNRSTTVLQKEMISSGSRFKCFTTRELVVYYAECLSENLELVISILTDCVFGNKFSDESLTKQKDIVIRAMEEKEKDQNSLTFDYLHGGAFAGTPLGQTVLGKSKNLQQFNTSTMSTYVKNLFIPTRTVLAAVGAITTEDLVNLAKVHLCWKAQEPCLENVYRFTASDVRYRNDELPLCSVAMAFEGPPLGSSDATVLDVAAHVIGGWDQSQVCGHNHPCTLAKAGYFSKLCDAYRSFNIKYRDTSLWGIHFLANRLYLEDFMHNVHKEFMKLCFTITEKEVERGKSQLLSRLLSKTESARGACIDLGKYTLYCNRRPTLYERYQDFDQVTAAALKDVCGKYLYDQSPAVAAVGPTEALPECNWFTAGQYWLRT